VPKTVLKQLAEAESHIIHAQTLLIEVLQRLDEELRKQVMVAFEKLDEVQQQLRAVKKQLARKNMATYTV